MPAEGISAPNRRRLDEIHRLVGRPFTVSDAEKLWHLPRPKVRRLLAQFAERGWLSRIRRDAYALVPLGAASPTEWREDPWAVAALTFSPSYLGGWTAAEHWSLTEQIFHDLVVFTGSRVRHGEVTLQGTTYRLRYAPKEHFFGLKSEWRGQTRVSVSDPSRTIIDVLDDPAAGGGMRHVVDMLSTYFGTDHRADKLLLEYSARLGNRTVFKRLGFLVEHLGFAAPELISECRAKISHGLSWIDPAGPRKGRIVKRWNLRINFPLEVSL